MTGWVGAKLPRISHRPKPDRQSEIEVRIGNCLQLIDRQDNIYDAIATDAPYSILCTGTTGTAPRSASRRNSGTVCFGY